MSDGLEALAAMEYPGRIIILGAMPDGRGVAFYAITGRSSSSQARKFVKSKQALESRDICGIDVVPTDEQELKKGNADLLVYPAIAYGVSPDNAFLCVSNGKQTGSLVHEVRFSMPENYHVGSFQQSDVNRMMFVAQETWSYEDDAPNFTPRISGIIAPHAAVLGRISRDEKGNADRELFDVPLRPGEGWMITTYTGENKNPLPSSRAPPVSVGLRHKRVDDCVKDIYATLGPKNGMPDYRVGVVGVSRLPVGYAKIAIKNRFADAEAEKAR